MADSHAKTDLKKGDRVRASEFARSLGVIEEIREELIGSSGDTQDKALLIKVLWDNGVSSYLSPEKLEVI